MNSKAHPNSSTVRTETENGSSVKPQIWQLCLLSVFIFLGPLTARAQVIELVSPNESKQPTGRYGAGVKGLSDLTGDGIGELAVSTTETITGIAAVGSVYILNGRDFSVVWRLVSPESALSGSFGNCPPFLPSHIAEAPDLDGDKVPEIIVPALRSGAPRSQKDRVFVFSGASGVLLQTLVSPDRGPGDWFGAAVAGLATTRPFCSNHCRQLPGSRSRAGNPKRARDCSQNPFFQRGEWRGAVHDQEAG